MNLSLAYRPWEHVLIPRGIIFYHAPPYFYGWWFGCFFVSHFSIVHCWFTDCSSTASWSKRRRLIEQLSKKSARKTYQTYYLLLATLAAGVEILKIRSHIRLLSKYVLLEISWQFSIQLFLLLWSCCTEIWIFNKIVPLDPFPITCGFVIEISNIIEVPKNVPLQNRKTSISQQ